MTAPVTKQTPLPLRNDTVLGVCEALGQDLGVNPIWFRLAFIAPLFFQPMLTFAAYFTIGAIVAATRYFYPRTVAEAPAPALQAIEATPREEAREEALQIAA